MDVDGVVSVGVSAVLLVAMGEAEAAAPVEVELEALLLTPPALPDAPLDTII